MNSFLFNIFLNKKVRYLITERQSLFDDKVSLILAQKERLWYASHMQVVRKEKLTDSIGKIF